MYYELLILGSLMAGPAHGYLIAKILQNIMGPYRKISPGRLYPLLTTLEATGLIVVDPSAAPATDRPSPRHQIPSRRYQITAAGRARFHHLMLDTASFLPEYQKVFVQKVVYFSFLAPTERLQLIEHYMAHCRSVVAYGAARAAEFADEGANQQDAAGMTAAQRADLLTAIQHTRHQWQQELLWTQQLRESLQASIDAADTQETESRTL